MGSPASTQSVPDLAASSVESPTETVTETDTVTVTAAPFHLFSFLLGLLVATGLVGGTVLLLRRPEPAPITIQPPPTPAPTATVTPTPLPAPITVFVSGAVAKPGLYVLEADARVGDALAGAGGLTDEADAVIINQAEPLWDGVQVHVPSKATGDAPVVAPERAPPAGVSGLAAAVSPNAGAGSAANGGLININSGSAGELESLPGIGPSKAQAIIANRPYDSVDDLERVPGIGAKTVDQLRDLVTHQ